MNNLEDAIRNIIEVGFHDMKLIMSFIDMDAEDEKMLSHFLNTEYPKVKTLEDLNIVGDLFSAHYKDAKDKYNRKSLEKIILYLNGLNPVERKVEIESMLSNFMQKHENYDYVDLGETERKVYKFYNLQLETVNIELTEMLNSNEK
jgi:hypothetical protein